VGPVARDPVARRRRVAAQPQTIAAGEPQEESERRQEAEKHDAGCDIGAKPGTL
jgi:hypothetical protein